VTGVQTCALPICSRPPWARLGGPSWGHSERSEESLRLLRSVHGREPSERFLVARRDGLVGMTPWPRPFDALGIAPGETLRPPRRAQGRRWRYDHSHSTWPMFGVDPIR